MKISIENLPLNMTANDLRELFSVIGDVDAAEISLATRKGITSLSGVIEMSQHYGATAVEELCHFNFNSIETRIQDATNVVQMRRDASSTVVVSLFPP